MYPDGLAEAIRAASIAFRTLADLLSTCPVHGPMRLREEGPVCVGWDGEGCPHYGPEERL